MNELTEKFEIQTEIDEAFAGKITTEELVKAAQAALVAEGLGRQAISLSVEIAGDEYVQRLNREYRGVDRTTDVLSFANEEAPDWDGRPGVVYQLERASADADEVLDEPEQDLNEYDDEADDGPANREFILPPEVATRQDRYLGDIVISYPQAERQAAEYGHSIQREVQELIVHGVFHLLGYDHEEREEREVMRSKEEAAAHVLDEAAQA